MSTSPPRSDLVRCEHCGVMVRIDRIQKHVLRVHTSPRPKPTPRQIVGGSGGAGSIDDGVHRHVWTERPTEFPMEYQVNRCRSCGKPAMSESDLCYTCESG